MCRQHSFRPAVEFLESRFAPANLTGSVVKGVLTLTADSASSDDDLTFQPGTIPGSFSITGENGTTINTATTFTFERVQSIVLKLKGGNDPVDFLGVLLGGNVTIVSGASTVGDNFNFEESLIGGTLTVTNGNTTGLDFVSLDAVEIGRSMIVNHGSGSTQVVLGSQGPVNIGGNVSVTSGAGNDEFRLDNVAIGGKLTSALGGGTNRVELARSFVHKSVLLQGGGGGDTVSVVDQRIGGNLTAKLGGGDNFFHIDSAADGPSSEDITIIDGQLAVSGGTGADTINIGSEKQVIVGGATSFVTGDETGGLGDSITIDDTEFLGAVLVDLGGGEDSLDFDASTTIDNHNVTIAGKLTVLGRGGNDDVRFGDNTSAANRLQLARQPALRGGGGTNILSAQLYVIDGVDLAVLTDVVNFTV